MKGGKTRHNKAKGKTDAKGLGGYKGLEAYVLSQVETDIERTTRTELMLMVMSQFPLEAAKNDFVNKVNRAVAKHEQMKREEAYRLAHLNIGQYIKETETVHTHVGEVKKLE